MAIIKIYLRNNAKNDWFKDPANTINTEKVWKSSDEGFVWTHSQYGCKVRFLLQEDKSRDDVNFVKVWHPSREWFDQARAIGTFTQWVYDNAYEYVKKIEISIRR